MFYFLSKDILLFFSDLHKFEKIQMLFARKSFLLSKFIYQGLTVQTICYKKSSKMAPTEVYL